MENKQTEVDVIESILKEKVYSLVELISFGSDYNLEISEDAGKIFLEGLKEKSYQISKQEN